MPQILNLAVFKIILNEIMLKSLENVTGRNSDNELVEQRYGWSPSTPLQDGLEATYAWVYDQVKRSLD